MVRGGSMKKLTQKEVILKYLQENEGITSQDAWSMYGITRLADVIYKLKKDGVKIETIIKTVDTYFGKTDIAVYRLVRK